MREKSGPAPLPTCASVMTITRSGHASGSASSAGDPRVVLSLDFRGEHFLGPPALLAEPDAWPDRVIVMTLAHVGSGAGPDFSRIAAIRALAGPRKLYAAGGIRGAADLADLARAGVAGALVAS